MLFKEKTPPREYQVGKLDKFFIKDCGTLELQPNEQVTFLSENSAEYDVTRKSWGFYATPSTNSRLLKFGFKTALVKNSLNYHYVLIVKEGLEEEFNKYISRESMEVVAWLHQPEKYNFDLKS